MASSEGRGVMQALGYMYGKGVNLNLTECAMRTWTWTDLDGWSCMMSDGGMEVGDGWGTDTCWVIDGCWMMGGATDG